MYDVAIIGCGVIGAATAYELSHYNTSVVILEAKDDVADGTTKANSAILHAGYDPEPGTEMAKLNVRGVALAKEICRRLDVGYSQCGSLVVALSEDDLPMLQTLYDRGVANGVPGLELLDAEQTHAKEPNLAPTIVGALWAPSAAIVNPWEYAIAMTEVAVRNGVELKLRAPVTAIRKTEAGTFALTTPQGEVEARTVVNAAGVDAAHVHDMIAAPSFHITPTRGQYYLLDHSAAGLVGTVVFQCPNEKGKGVLVAPTVHGNIIVGPDAEPLPDDQEYNTACTAAGQDFVASQARLSVPSLDLRDNIRNFAGVRANIDSGDFVIAEAPDVPGFVDLAGMKSPGLSCAPAVAEEARGILTRIGVVGERKTDYRDGRTHVRFAEKTPEERAALIAENPLYGHVICRCETVTEAEIVWALHTEVPATTIDGVKRRAGTGMGRCQGGFCGPRVVQILARELQVPVSSIVKERAASHLYYDKFTGGGTEGGK